MNRWILFTLVWGLLAGVAIAHDVRDGVALSLNGTNRLLSPKLGEIVLDTSGTAAAGAFKGYTWSGWQTLGRPSTPFLHATKSSSTTLLTANPNTRVVFGSEEADSHNAFDGSTGIFTVPSSGRYLITVHLLGPATTAEGRCKISVRIAGTLYIQLSQTFKEITTNSIPLSTMGVETVNATAGDTIEIVGSTELTSFSLEDGVLSITKLID